MRVLLIEDDASTARSIELCKLRKKLANVSGGKDYIETVRGRGYALREPCNDDSQVLASARVPGAYGKPSATSTG
jgi:DNA-binding winged helix-turn-helix (wHTH) protein